MDNSKDKIHVIIAARHILYRLGIKTILNVIGIEPELIEADSWDMIKSLQEKSDYEFVIISEEILPDPKLQHLESLKCSDENCSIMIINDGSSEEADYPCLSLDTENKKDIIERFQHFFFNNQSDEANSTTDKSVLSFREIDVLKAVATGASNKEIADMLFISINTVITHRKNITEKLGIKTIAGLTVYAIMNKFISPDEVTR